MSRCKSKLQSRRPRRLDLFVCGPTVYDWSYLGHAKTYTQFDFIARYLRNQGYEVFYLQNITDIDDKIITEDAAEMKAAFSEIGREEMNGPMALLTRHRTTREIDSREGLCFKNVSLGLRFTRRRRPRRKEMQVKLWSGAEANIQPFGQ